MSAACRNLTMFISIGVVFYVLHVMMLVLAFATQFTSSEEEITVDPVVDTDGSRLLQITGDVAMTTSDGSDPEDKVEPLNIIRTWTFISLVAMISFGYTELMPIMVKLYGQYKDPEQNLKIKEKALGGYSREDPLR